MYLFAFVQRKSCCWNYFSFSQGVSVQAALWNSLESAQGCDHAGLYLQLPSKAIEAFTWLIKGLFTKSNDENIWLQLIWANKRSLISVYFAQLNTSLQIHINTESIPLFICLKKPGNKNFHDPKPTVLHIWLFNEFIAHITACVCRKTTFTGTV